jgi:hypothetical protein
MIIPEIASKWYMPVTRNIPLDIKGQKSWWKKYWLWRNNLPHELLIEDFYQILPKECNSILGFSEDIELCCFVPKNFLFNGASIPKRLTWIYLPNGILYIGAFFHDFMYSYGGLIIFTIDTDLIFIKVDRSQADDLFYLINEDFNEFKTATKPALNALKLFGSFAWKNCRKREEFLLDFPQYKDIYEV